MQGEMEPTRDTIIARVSAACASQMTPAQVLWLFEDAGITDLEELKACCRSDRAFIFTESIQGMERAVALICINRIRDEFWTEFVYVACKNLRLGLGLNWMPQCEVPSHVA